VRAFAEPRVARSKQSPLLRSKSTVQFFAPSYSLYPVLVATHGATASSHLLADDFALPTPEQLRAGSRWDFDAALTFVTTPNAPSGRGYDTAALEKLCRAQRGVVVLDEAYVDFAPQHAMGLALRCANVIVSRTFSKGYSLCFQRVGYFVAHRELISALDKIRDSYNVNGLGQIAAEATLRDLPYYQRNFERIIKTRERTATALEGLGFAVFPSQTNFLFVRPPLSRSRRVGGAGELMERLRNRRILVRWFNTPQCRDYLRITIGTDDEMDKLLSAVRRCMTFLKPSDGM
jgi:histidinol-phosphate aminotransferase